MGPTKQLLLRVDEQLHSRLSAQARASGTSVNALANEILGLAIDPGNLSRRDRLKLKLIAIGQVGKNRSAPTPQVARPMTSAELNILRERALESLRGVGRIADDLISHERDAR